MKSEDVLDVDDIDSIGDGFYSEECSDDGHDADYGDDSREDGSRHYRDQSYTILSEDDIRQRQEEDISGVCGVLSVSRVAASILLRHYGWNVGKLYDEWFSEEERVRRAVGLWEDPIQPPSTSELTCRICYEDHPCCEMCAAACGHSFCRACWQSYIGSSISNGSGCLMLRCPDPSCSAAVGQDMVDDLATEEDKEKYSRYFLRSYIEDNKKTKWCPAPGCGFAVEFVAGDEGYDVRCECSHNFCWNCAEDAHRPVDCSTVTKWILKNSSENESTNWILANSKPCPKCKTPIEKNEGCMHMTCRSSCGQQFCWLCLGPWEEHGERTGGFYHCNSYEEAKRKGAYEEADMRRETAKAMVEKYNHYYERWATNQSSRQKALENLWRMQNKELAKLSDKSGLPETEFGFIIQAWLQIAECRRVLKWTYAYGYYLPEHEETKRRFLEYLQGEAEATLERLHQCTEMELQPYLDAASLLWDFQHFRRKLVRLTTVTQNYFDNLVRALEDGVGEG